MPKPACVPCQRFFRPKRNGVHVLEGMPIGPLVPPGTEAADRWEPYKIWQADLWECQGCGAQIISGYGQRPAAEHYEPHFAATLAATGAERLKINDC